MPWYNQSMKNQVILPRSEEIFNLFRAYGVSSAALFGSRAFGDNRPESDYDILIDFHPSSKISFFGVMKLKGELEDILGQPVDLVTKEGLSPYLRDYILPTIKPLYEEKS